MKRIFAFIILWLALAACTAPQVQTPGSAATGSGQMNMANPASVYCLQNGNKLEIRTAIDGSQSGICVFPGGGSCDEWAYFRGECGFPPQKNPAPTLTVAATPGAGKESTEGKRYPGDNASGGYMAPGTTEELSDWWGIIRSTQPGAQFDDYFERQDLGQGITFGIDSIDAAVKAQIVAQRDSGKIVHLYGTLLSNVPDYNGSQIQVYRIEVKSLTI